MATGVCPPLRRLVYLIPTMTSSYSMTQVAALVPKTELDGDMGDAHVALQARLMSQALRKLSHSLSLSQTILLFINQVFILCLLPWSQSEQFVSIRADSSCS
jgi:hypothetical protein